jgi:hypothetical protein
MAFRQAKHKLTSSVAPPTTTNPIPTNIPSSNNRQGTVGYAPDAAWLAIRRHMQISSFDDQVVRSFVFYSIDLSFIRIIRLKVKKVH